MDSNLKQVTIYTDGACSGNPGPGGWAALLMFQGAMRELSGGEAETTNNRMELMATIAALTQLKSPCAVALYTDSKYVLQGFTEWLPGWQKKGWKTADKKPVKNVELWQELDALVAISPHELRWHWVKGHAGNPGNEAADALANQGVEKVLSLA